MRVFLAMAMLLAGATAARADSAIDANPFNKYAAPDLVVAAVQTRFQSEAGKPVRLSVYDSEKAFLEVAAIKHQGVLDETGLAIVELRGLPAGDYAFAAYLDEDGDGKLKRGALGQPKEPIAFSNGVVPKLRKPTFDETKVSVKPGAVVVITLED